MVTRNIFYKCRHKVLKMISHNGQCLLQGYMIPRPIILAKRNTFQQTIIQKKKHLPRNLTADTFIAPPQKFDKKRSTSIEIPLAETMNEEDPNLPIQFLHHAQSTF